MAENTVDDNAADTVDEPTEAPATWENVLVGKAKQAAGHLFGDDDLVSEGETQEDIAHELHDEAHPRRHHHHTE